MIAGLPWIVWAVLAVAGFALFRSIYLMLKGTRPVGDAARRAEQEAWFRTCKACVSRPPKKD